jgi:hypothetical protein
MTTPRGQRIEDNCKTIWGGSTEYDLEFETDDYEYYVCLVRKDYGTSFGPPLLMTGICPSIEAAAREMDRMLLLMARAVKRGTPMTKDEELNIFGGRRGEYRNILSKFIDLREEKESKVKNPE